MRCLKETSEIISHLTSDIPITEYSADLKKMHSSVFGKIFLFKEGFSETQDISG